MNKKIFLVIFLTLIFSLSLMGCKSESNESSSDPVPENEGVAYFLEYCENMWPSTTFQIVEVLEVTHYYVEEDVEQAYCIGTTNSKTDDYSLALVYNINGEWDVNWSPSIDKTCADEFK